MILFKSTKHQRYEDDIPVRGLQVCNRIVKIEQNINGYKGYDLISGDGYIVSIINVDDRHPLWNDNYQMSPKPMRLVDKDDATITLRGYNVFAQTPFGMMEVDLSDYGITLYVANDEIVKCRLDMFDRNTYIEYYK